MSKLKGVTTIQLFDAKTGELQQEVREENMITNAIENILNPPDYLATGLNTAGTDLAVNMREIVEPVYSKMLNGIMIFDKNIDEDVNITMPPFDCKEIGHAGGVNGVSGSEYSRIGTYNSAESGSITNGYRHVWDFGSDRANGVIACVCLTSNAGGNVGQRPQQTYQGGGITFNGFVNYDNDSSYRNLWGQQVTDMLDYTYEASAFYIDTLSNGDIRMLVKVGTGTAIDEIIINNPFNVGLFRKAARVKSKTRIFSLNGGQNPYIYYDWKAAGYTSYPGDSVCKAGAINTWDAQNDDSKYIPFHPYVYKNQIHIIYPINRLSNYQLRHLILSVDDYSVVQDKKISLERQPKTDVFTTVYSSYQNNPLGITTYGAYYNRNEGNTQRAGCCYFDNHYFYIDVNNHLVAANTDGSLYQDIGSYVLWKTYIDDEQNICFGSGVSYSDWCGTIDWIKKDKDTNLYYITTSWINMGGNYTTSSNYDVWYNKYFSKVKNAKLPLYFTASFSYWSSQLYAYTDLMSFYTYLGSINNLATPVTKNAGQTMKITYDITET